MISANRSRKFWLLSAACIGCFVWLAYGILQAADTDRKPIVLDRAPLFWVEIFQIGSSR